MASKTQAVDLLPAKNKCSKVASNPKKLKGGTQRSITDSLCVKQGHQKSKVLSDAGQAGNRKSLQTLQPCGNESGLTRPHIMQEGKENKAGHIRPDIVDKVTVYVDPAPTAQPQKQGGKEKVCHNTDEQEAYELMVQEPIPESYWKELAEQRRQALEDSLIENEELHQANEELQREVAELKEENSKLAELASEAEYFAGILQEVIQTDNSNGKNEHGSEARKSAESHLDECAEQPPEATTSQKSTGHSEPHQGVCSDTHHTTNVQQNCQLIKKSHDSDCCKNKSESTSDTQNLEQKCD